MSETIYNRDSFLDSLVAKLGRSRITDPVIRPELSHDCHHQVMAELSQQELAEVLLDYTKNTLGALAMSCNREELNQALISVCEGYGAGKIVLSGDQRLTELNINQALSAQFDDVYTWDPAQDAEVNIQQAEQAKLGIVFAELALAESGSMVLHSDPSKGRAVSLLPEVSVFIVPQSQIVPRMTQATTQLHQMAQRGERLPSCVNFISGPSSTADIELIKVVGVHGPLHAAYVIISDM